MGQALTTQNWPGWDIADEFMLEAHLHVPSSTQQQRPTRHDHNQKQNHADRSSESSPLPTSTPPLMTSPKHHHHASPINASDDASDDSDCSYSLPSTSSPSIHNDSSNLAAPNGTTHSTRPEQEPSTTTPLTNHWPSVLALSHRYHAIYAPAIRAWIKAPIYVIKKQNGTSPHHPDDGTPSSNAGDDEGSSPWVWKRGIRRPSLASYSTSTTATTTNRASLRTWTAADVVDVATRAGPLRWWRARSQQQQHRSQRRQKQQHQHQPCEGFVREARDMGWTGAGLARALLRAGRREGGTDDGSAMRTELMDVVRVLATFYPNAAPWTAQTPVGSPGGDGGVGREVEGEVAAAEELERVYRRVWVAMAVGWVEALGAWAGEEGGVEEEDGGGEGDGVGVVDRYEGWESGSWEMGSDGDLADGSDGYVDEAALEELSEVMMGDEVLAAAAAALARVKERAERLMPSDGSDEVSEDSEDSEEDTDEEDNEQ